MNIRNATYHDAPAIKSLLEQLGYSSRLSMLIDQLERLFNKNDHQVFVYELKKEVVGFASVHCLPQLAFDGAILIISYFLWIPRLRMLALIESWSNTLQALQDDLNVSAYKFIARIGERLRTNFICNKDTRNTQSISRKDWFMANSSNKF